MGGARRAAFTVSITHATCRQIAPLLMSGSQRPSGRVRCALAAASGTTHVAEPPTSAELTCDSTLALRRARRYTAAASAISRATSALSLLLSTAAGAHHLSTLAADNLYALRARDVMSVVTARLDDIAAGAPVYQLRISCSNLSWVVAQHVRRDRGIECAARSWHDA